MHFACYLSSNQRQRSQQAPYNDLDGTVIIGDAKVVIVLPAVFLKPVFKHVVCVFVRLQSVSISSGASGS